MRIDELWRKRWRISKISWTKWFRQKEKKKKKKKFPCIFFCPVMMCLWPLSPSNRLPVVLSSVQLVLSSSSWPVFVRVLQSIMTGSTHTGLNRLPTYKRRRPNWCSGGSFRATMRSAASFFASSFLAAVVALLSNFFSHHRVASGLPRPRPSSHGDQLAAIKRGG